MKSKIATYLSIPLLMSGAEVSAQSFDTQGSLSLDSNDIVRELKISEGPRATLAYSIRNETFSLTGATIADIKGTPNRNVLSGRVNLGSKKNDLYGSLGTNLIKAKDLFIEGEASASYERDIRSLEAKIRGQVAQSFTDDAQRGNLSVELTNDDIGIEVGVSAQRNYPGEGNIYTRLKKYFSSGKAYVGVRDYSPEVGVMLSP